MAKKIGVSAVVLGALGVIFAITVFAFKYAHGADSKVNEVEHRVTVNEVKVDGIRCDLRRIETEQKAMGNKLDAKLDKILTEVKR
jgi:hypothetical protein